MDGHQGSFCNGNLCDTQESEKTVVSLISFVDVSELDLDKMQCFILWEDVLPQHDYWATQCLP
jgi:hypothetical protein